MAAKKKSANKSVKKAATQPAATPPPRKAYSDPVGEWLAKAARDRALPDDVINRFAQGKVTYEEARKLWWEANKSTNVWSDLE